MKEINTVAVELIKKSKSVINAATDIKNGFSFSKLTTLSREVCTAVETYTQEVGTLSSQVKLSLAIELLVNLVDIPYVPQFVERKIYKIVLGKAINHFNSTIGKAWLPHVESYNEFTKVPTDVTLMVRVGGAGGGTLPTEIVQSVAADTGKKVVKEIKKKASKNLQDVRENLRKRVR